MEWRKLLFSNRKQRQSQSPCTVFAPTDIACSNPCLNWCLRRIMNQLAKNPEVVSNNKDLWTDAKKEPVDEMKWRCPDKEAKIAKERAHSAKWSLCSGESGVDLGSPGAEKERKVESNLEENSWRWDKGSRKKLERVESLCSAVLYKPYVPDRSDRKLKKIRILVCAHHFLQ